VRELYAPDVEASSAGYARRFEGPVGEWMLDVQADAIRTVLAGLPKGTTALDVGGGHGQLAPILAAIGFHVTVLGSTPDADGGLRRAELSGRVPFLAGPLDRLPFADASVDVVTSIRTLAHMPRWEVFLAELCRVARVAVVVDYASTRSLNTFASMLFSLKARVERNTRPFRLQSPRAVAEAFARERFDVTRSVPQFAWPMALHRALPVQMATALERLPAATGLTRLVGSPVIVRADRRPGMS